MHACILDISQYNIVKKVNGEMMMAKIIAYIWEENTIAIIIFHFC